MQTFTFYASKDKLENRSHSAGQIGVKKKGVTLKKPNSCSCVIIPLSTGSKPDDPPSP